MPLATALAWITPGCLRRGQTRTELAGGITWAAYACQQAAAIRAPTHGDLKCKRRAHEPMAIDQSTDVIEAYYATWQNGIDSFDEAGLRRLLAADFVYDGPIAGRRPGVESFVRGLKAFVMTLKSLRMIAQLRSESEAAFLYDCDVIQPAGTFSFAEFLRIGDGQIH